MPMTTAEAWNKRIEAEYDAGNIPNLQKYVLLSLPSFRGYGGQIFPSHQALADRVRMLFRCRCSTKTVERALKQGRSLGLLFWLPRHRRDGWRRLRTSNLYFINIPAGPVAPGRGPVWRRYSTDRHSVRIQVQEDKEAKKAALEGMFAEAARCGDLLGARRADLVARGIAS